MAPRQGHGDPCSWHQAWLQGPPVLLLLRGWGAAIVLWEPRSSESGPLLLLGCAQLLHAPDLVQQARDEGLDRRGPLERPGSRMISCHIHTHPKVKENDLPQWVCNSRLTAPGKGEHSTVNS